MVKDAAFFTRFGLNVVIRQTNSQPLVQMTAREFMFGYKSALMTLGNNFMPGWIYFDKLGLIDRVTLIFENSRLEFFYNEFFSQMYDFDGDFETIYTGEHDVTKTGLIDTYNGARTLPQWKEPCGNIQYASDGTKFPGDIKPDDELKFFRKSMCRAKPLVSLGVTKIVHRSICDL